MNLLDLPLSEPTREALEAANVTTLHSALVALPGIGPVRAEEIESALLAHLKAKAKPRAEKAPEPVAIEEQFVNYQDKPVTVQWLLDQLAWHAEHRDSRR